MSLSSFFRQKICTNISDELHILPIVMYPYCHILVLPSYDKNVNVTIVAILSLYFLLNAVIL